MCAAAAADADARGHANASCPLHNGIRHVAMLQAGPLQNLPLTAAAGSFISLALTRRAWCQTHWARWRTWLMVRTLRYSCLTTMPYRECKLTEMEIFGAGLTRHVRPCRHGAAELIYVRCGRGISSAAPSGSGVDILLCTSWAYKKLKPSARPADACVTMQSYTLAESINCPMPRSPRCGCTARRRQISFFCLFTRPWSAASARLWRVTPTCRRIRNG